MERVLRYYEGYINKLCTRTLYDEYGYPHECVDGLNACRRPQAATLAPRRGVGRLTFPHRGKASWRTRCLARRKKDVPDVPYTCGYVP